VADDWQVTLLAGLRMMVLAEPDDGTERCAQLVRLMADRLPCFGFVASQQL
jgi:hypothetical protein